MTLALVPNFDHDAERAVLGALLADPEVALREVRDTAVTWRDFADPRHQVLYAACLELDRIGRPVDPVTLGQYLEQRRALDKAGGKPYLAGLLDEVPHARNVRAHLVMVRAAARARSGKDDRTARDTQLAQVGEAQAFLDLPAERFLRLPWPRLDATIGGTMPGTLSFLAGHPGGGKTSFLLTLMLRLLASGKRVYYAGLESRPNILRTQVACRVLGLDHGAVLAGNAQAQPDWPDVRARLVAELERQRDLDGAYGRLRFAPHTHVDTAAACEIMAEAADFGADLVVVDHIDHVTADGKQGLYAESRHVVQVLDSLSKQHGLKTLAATQTNWTGRSADPYRNHRPIQEEHLYMGGHKVHVAHWIVGVYRPLEGGKVPKDLDKMIRGGERPLTDALAKHTVAVNVLKSRVLGDGKHAIVPLGFWRGEVLDEVPRHRQLQSADAAA